jgi:hypothetical protein
MDREGGTVPSENGEGDKCPHLVTLDTSTTLQVMGAAFDTALLSLPPNLQDNEVARRKLALIILRHADRGEPDADLGTLALLDFKRASQ